MMMRAGAFALAIGCVGGCTAFMPFAAQQDPIAVRVLGALARERLPAVQNVTHELRLSAHSFRGTRWAVTTIERALIDSARLLAQCGVAVVHAELRIVDAPRRFHYYYTPDSRQLLRSIDAPRPAIFFVEDTKNNPAFDAEAIGFANSKPRPELTNTIWVAYGARDLPFAIAHELVHLLMNTGEHSHEPGNLMRADTAPGNNKLTAVQCEHMRSHGEANGLLTKATSAGLRRDSATRP
jgi:hypothetical protein